MAYWGMSMANVNNEKRAKAFIKKAGWVDVSIGAPIPSEGREPEEMMAQVQTWIESEMRRLDPDAYL
mgnify:CR=1 FL=1